MQLLLNVKYFRRLDGKFELWEPTSKEDVSGSKKRSTTEDDEELLYDENQKLPEDAAAEPAKK